MSSIGRDDDDDSSTDGGGSPGRRPPPPDLREFISGLLPPAPEDQLAMTGDVASLFLYSFLDHALDDAYVDMVNFNDAIVSAADGSPTAASVASDAAYHSSLERILPVWYDATHSAFGPHLTASVFPMLHTAHAPIISTAGGSACVLTAAWIAAGYVTGAFLFRNTLGCDTSRAISVAGRAWIVSSAIVIAAALASDQFAGWADCVRTPSLGGLTKADGDFIFDSLSVLVAWRFILSSMLGYGDRD